MKNTIEQDFLLQSDNALRSDVRCADNAPRHGLNPDFLGMSVEHQIQPSSALRGDVQSQQNAEKSLLERKRLFFSHVIPLGVHMR